MDWLKDNIIATLALVVAVVGTLIAYYSFNKSSDIAVNIFGTNKSFLEEYISLGKSRTELLINAEISNSSSGTKLLSITPSLAINVYRYLPNSLEKVAHLNISFVPETKDFEAYEVTSESVNIESGRELSASTSNTTVFINTLIASIDDCINCKKTRFPDSDGYSHSIIYINENNTLPLKKGSNIDWLSKNLEKGLTVFVEDAVFRAGKTEKDKLVFAQAFKQFGKNWHIAAQSLFIEYEIAILIDTEDNKLIRGAETFYSLAHLVPKAKKAFKRN